MKGKDKDAFKAFAEAAGAEQNTLRVQNLWEEFGAEVDIIGTGVKLDVEQMQRAFDTLDPKQAQVVLDELAKRTETLDHNSDQYKTNTDFIKKNQKAIDDKTQASLASRAATNNMTADEQSARRRCEGAGPTTGGPERRPRDVQVRRR